MISISSALATADHWRWTPDIAMATALAILLAAVYATRHGDRAPTERRRHAKRAVPGARVAYLAAIACTGVSLDTSWNYFGADGLNITPTIVHVALFAVLELALVTCGVMMRAGIHVDGRPGPARIVAWACCGASAYMAWTVSGPFGGTARVALGPVLGLVMLHLALGIEVRARRGARSTLLGRVAAELREMTVSFLGLADETRPAVERRRDRAARRAARLAGPRALPWSRSARLARALIASGAADDLAVRGRVFAQLAVGQNAAALRTVRLASPWPVTNTVPDSSANTNTADVASTNRPANRVPNMSANTNTGVRTAGGEHAANMAEQSLASGEQLGVEHAGQPADGDGERPRLHALPGGAANTQAELIRRLAEHEVTDPDEVVRRVREQFPDAKADSVRTQLRRITRGAQPPRAVNQ